MRRHDSRNLRVRVLFVGQEFRESFALGAIVRRTGIRTAFAERGVSCSNVELPTHRRAPAELLSVIGTPHTHRARLMSLVGQSDAIVLEGLPTAVAVIRQLRRTTKNVIHVDVCDSWMRLSGAGVGAGTSPTARLARRLKRTMAGAALRYMSRYADSVSYISDRDCSEDGSFLGRGTMTYTIPNGNPVRVTTKEVNWDEHGPMVVVADWSYAPNIEMLRTVLNWVSAISSISDLPRLRIYGPNLPENVVIPDGVEHIGWVDEVSLAYDRASCALALVTSGSGVKNKVLEPLSYGIPVIATEEALNGLPYHPTMVHKFRGELTGEEVKSWLSDLAESGITRMQFPSWEQNVEALVADIFESPAS